MKLIFNVVLFFLASSCLANSFKNESFDKAIKTMRLKSSNLEFDLPIVNLGTQDILNFSFDLLENDVKDYSYTFQKCDANWNKSEDIFYHDFIEGMEDNFITDFQLSENTAVNYIHYELKFPNNDCKFLLSGNYILLVKEVETKSIVITYKFYVVDSKVKIEQTPTTPIEFEYRYTHHIINFNVNHSLMPSDNPINEFRAVILQNGRQDNAKYDVKPLFVKNNKLIFSNEKQNLFEAGNEYRIIDFRDLKLQGVGVESIFYQDSIYHIIPTKDFKKAYLKYKQTSDHNGNFFIERMQNIGDPDLTTDYAFVHFRFHRSIPLDSSTVFIIGKMGNGEVERNLKMYYKDSLEHYEAHILLKQGVYDYAYTARKIGQSSLSWEDTDGTHYQTENSYTILLYFKGFNDLTETLIGVKRFIYQ